MSEHFIFSVGNEAGTHLLEDGLSNLELRVGSFLVFASFAVAVEIHAQEPSALFDFVHRFEAMAVVIVIGALESKIGRPERFSLGAFIELDRLGAGFIFNIATRSLRGRRGCAAKTHAAGQGQQKCCNTSKADWIMNAHSLIFPR